MSVKIRLTRVGTRKKPYYRIIAVDSRKKRDGAWLENLGVYQPLKQEDEQVVLQQERIKEWLSKGARPSHTVKVLLNKKGIMIE
ncbi:MAG: 30S ribosomal protein S16 [Spirochaetota bacterium]|nr:MAG: 30S ribosomal protein S16 [Spirochaetota bacterium]